MEDTKQCPFCAEEIKAAAVKCKHCGSEITLGSYRPGARMAPFQDEPERKTSAIVKYGGGFLIICFGFALYASLTSESPSVPSGSPDPQIVSEPSQSASLPGKLRQPAVAPKRPVYKISAAELYQEYESNEVSIQRRIGRSIVQVSGIVQSIDEDFSKDAVLQLVTGNEFATAHINLVSADHDRAASLSRGQFVTVQCDSVIRIIGSPVGEKCHLLN